MTTGKALVRQALRARNRTPAFLANLREEIGGLSTSAIESWIEGDGKALTRAQLNAVVASIWGGAVELGEDDLLRPANRVPAASMGSPAPPYVKTEPTPLTAAAPRPATDEVVPLGRPRPALLRRAGWAS